MMDTPAQPVARLRLPSGEFLLYPGQQVSLGRTPDNDIVIDDLKISRIHAVLAWDGSGFVLQDQGSSNGTYLNSERQDGSPHMLFHGDQISFGGHVLVFELLTSQPQGEPARSMDSQSAPRLVVAGGLDLGREYPLWGEVIVIGRDSRDATWEIRLTDRSVSRPHARLELGDAGYILLDLSSVNGTRLNDRPVLEPVLLKDGDIITVGGTRLVFHA